MKKHLVNEQIKSTKILLLSSEGQKIGDMSYREAMRLASEQELDLMQVGENKDFAICKLVNYSKWLYHEQKRKHKEDLKHKSQEMKSMHFRPAIGEHDFQLKAKKVSEFLTENHKVKVVVKFKTYRETTMRELNKEFIDKLLETINPYGSLDGKINYSGKEINFIVKPIKKVSSKEA